MGKKNKKCKKVKKIAQVEQVESCPKRVGVFGGTFDPVTAGHIACVRAALGKVDLDEVRFVPIAQPAWAPDVELEPIEDRVALLKKAVGDEPKFKIDMREVERPEGACTARTVRELREELPAGSGIFVIGGVDSMFTVPQWSDVQDIERYARLIAVMPQGYVLHKDSDRYLNLVQRHVVDWVEMGPCEEDALSDDFARWRKIDLWYRLDKRRYKHTMRVAKTAKKLAAEYGVDAKKAYLAGLLHDWDKCFASKEMSERAELVGLKVDPFVLENAPQTLHGATAACALAAEFPQIPADVLQAVERHTVGATGMTELDMVVFVADFLDPARGAIGVDTVAECVGVVSLEELFYLALATRIASNISRDLVLHPATAEVWNHYVLRHNAFAAQVTE